MKNFVDWRLLSFAIGKKGKERRVKMDYFIGRKPSESFEGPVARACMSGCENACTGSCDEECECSCNGSCVFEANADDVK